MPKCQNQNQHNYQKIYLNILPLSLPIIILLPIFIMQALSRLVHIKEIKEKKSQSYKTDINPKAYIKQLQTPEVRKGQTKFIISEKQFITLCRKAKKLFLSQPCLLRLSGPIIIATGTLGYFFELTQIFKVCGQPTYFNYLLLGDYIGRGPASIECMVFLLSYKVLMKNNFFLLRGCHQTIALARSSRLYDECLERFSPRAWAEVTQVLCSLPFAAIVDEQIFCVHGGISPQMKTLEEINKTFRPLDVPESGVLNDLIWSDPSYRAPVKPDHRERDRDREKGYLIPEYDQSERGYGFTFTQEAVENFLCEYRLEMVCRAHEVIFHGFQLAPNRRLATICSLPNYCGIYNNSGAVMNVDDEVNIFFRIMKQKKYFPQQLSEDEHPQSRFSRIIREKYEKRKKKKQEQKRKAEEQRRKEFGDLVEQEQKKVELTEEQQKELEKQLEQEEKQKKLIKQRQKTYRQKLEEEEEQRQLKKRMVAKPETQMKRNLEEEPIEEEDESDSDKDYGSEDSEEGNRRRSDEQEEDEDDENDDDDESEGKL